MTQPDQRDAQPSEQDVALIVGGGPGISSSCARLFAKNGMRVAIAARNTDKPVLLNLGEDPRSPPIRMRREPTSGGGTALPECCSRPWDSYSCRAQH